MSTAIDNARNLPVVYYRVSISGLAPNKNVKEMSAATEETAQAAKGTVTTLLRRIPKTYAGPLTAISGKIRNLFYQKTIQLGDAFAVPISMVPAFRAQLQTLCQEYELYRTKLIEASESGDLERLAKAELSNLADKVDIPTTDAIKKSYGISIRTDINYTSSAVQAAMELLQDDLKAQLKAEVEESTKAENAEQLTAVTRTIVTTIQNFLADVQERCAGDPKGIQYKTMVDKLQHIVNVLPAYNVTNNPELAKLIETVGEKFANMNKDILKIDQTARQKAIDTANELTKTFASMF